VRNCALEIRVLQCTGCIRCGSRAPAAQFRAETARCGRSANRCCFLPRASPARGRARPRLIAGQSENARRSAAWGLPGLGWILFLRNFSTRNHAATTRLASSLAIIYPYVTRPSPETAFQRAVPNSWSTGSPRVVRNAEGSSRAKRIPRRFSTFGSAAQSPIRRGKMLHGAGAKRRRSCNGDDVTDRLDPTPCEFSALFTRFAAQHNGGGEINWLIPSTPKQCQSYSRKNST